MLRPATPADDAFLRRLFTGCDAELGLLPPALRDQLLAMQYAGRQLSWSAAYSDAEDWILCAEDGEPAGRMLLARDPNSGWLATKSSAANPPAPGSFRLVDLAVLPEFQRQGIARAALRQAQACAAKSGGALSLRVARNNAAAQGLYSELGFTVTGSDDIALELNWHAVRPQEAAA